MAVESVDFPVEDPALEVETVEHSRMRGEVKDGVQRHFGEVFGEITLVVEPPIYNITLDK